MCLNPGISPVYAWHRELLGPGHIGHSGVFYLLPVPVPPTQQDDCDDDEENQQGEQHRNQYGQLQTGKAHAFYS